MSDWIDELRERVETNERVEAEKEAAKLRGEEDKRNTAISFFGELRAATETLAPTINARLYGGRREVVFSYENYINDGKHFILDNGPYHVRVDLDSQVGKISVGFSVYAHNTGRHLPVSTDDFSLRTEGQSVFNEKTGEGVKSGEIAKHILTKLVERRGLK